ncbi:hypothetical protein BUALT_Bualt15G0001000 [Buddleja alternifolia]|uniref:Phosphoglycerate mutase n=1 Tax=Buddleja alternifolia TaxID=168488 RepID=A0AAV6WKK1_9LAMI|nr:hypothetical protein BUALT_Bualt15G0001000 [Buddleja alternifolia]
METTTGTGSSSSPSPSYAPLPPLFLKNSYWILRHGKSIPNQRAIIVSSLENGILEEYQLASDGVHQALSAGHSFLKCIPEIGERFFGSSFELKSHDKVNDPQQTHDFHVFFPLKYTEIWAMDEKDPFTQPEGGESVANVVIRLTRALTIMESEFEGCTVLIVSHGDPLQILQTILNAAKEHAAAGTPENDLTSRIQAITVPSVLSQHRKFALNTGELRQLL